jgi:dTDP-glucose 4,6-dehydratase
MTADVPNAPAHILVTGGAGFIGSHFTRFALQHARRAFVTVLDTAADHEGLNDLRRDASASTRLRIVEGDICDSELLRDLLGANADTAPTIDAIVHCAAATRSDRSIEDPGPFLRTNIIGTYTLLEAIRALRGRSATFVYVSTGDVYGEIEQDEAPLNEMCPARPSSPYAASKLSAEACVMAWRRTYGLRAVIARSAHTYGTGQNPETFIPRAIGCALSGEPVPLYGDGSHRKEWLHVDDHVEALWILTMAAGSWEHPVYNVRGEHDIANSALAEAILSAAGRPRTATKSIPDRPGHDRRLALDGTRMLLEFGWAPRRRLRDELPAIVAFERGRLSGASA